MIAFLYGQTEYSMLKNSIHLKDYVTKAKEYGYQMLSITDDNLRGHYKFYNLCIENGIKPLIGLELKENDFKILLYAYNKEGYKNLLKISSKKEINNIFLKDIKDYTKGLYAVLVGNPEYYFEIKDMFDYLALGVQEDDIDVYNFSLKNDIIALPILNTCYLYKEERIVYEALCKIGNNKIRKGNLYLKNKEELEESFMAMPNVFDNLDELYDMTSIDIFDKIESMPTYPNKSGKSSKEYLEMLSMLGLKKRLKDYNGNSEQYFKRLKYELNIIDKMGYNDYFLIVWDFIKYAKNNDILIGPGRGSGAGSLVAYSIGITSVDPIRYNLLFERFLNPERVSMPDIDTDIPDNRRDDVIRHVCELYKDNHVCYISAFDTFKIKSAIRDLGKVFEISDSRIVDISYMIFSRLQEEYNSVMSQENTINVLSKLENEITDTDLLKLCFVAKRIEGLPRNVSTHAAGIIISKEDLYKNIPLQKGLKGMMQSQLEAVDLEKLGLLKMDFLGLKNLSIVSNIIKEIDGYNAINIYNKIPLNDTKTYNLLSKGETLGIFQLESAGITKTIMKLKPNRIEDIVALLAIYRPGPMEYIAEFIERKHGKKVTYIHKDLKPILEETYGIIVYQEQIMLIAQKIAGYSLGEADILRRAISKKKEEILIEERNKFITHAKERGYDEIVANKIYDDIVKFANYGFNKSHSVAYAILSYTMAYFKANYPQIFVSKILNNAIGSPKASFEYIKYARKCSLKVLPPSVNKSLNEYVMVNNNIYMPFNAIKGISYQTSDLIVEERKNGLFKDFNDFKQRVKLAGSVLEALIYSSAFDEFNQTKKSMLDDISGNSLLIDNFLEDRILSLDEVDDFTLRLKEKEYLGFNIKYDIYTNIKSLMKMHMATSISNLILNKETKIIASFIDIKELITKNNEMMAVGHISDGASEIACVIFPKAFTSCSMFLKKDKLYLFSGYLKDDKTRGNTQFVISKIEGI